VYLVKTEEELSHCDCHMCDIYCIYINKSVIMFIRLSVCNKLNKFQIIKNVFEKYVTSTIYSFTVLFLRCLVGNSYFSYIYDDIFRRRQFNLSYFYLLYVNYHSVVNLFN
jgi:hypothetical protein